MYQGVCEIIPVSGTGRRIRSRLFLFPMYKVVLLILGACLMTTLAGAQDGFRSLAGESLDLADLKKTPVTVYVFMSPECPLCENYSATLKDLREEFPEDQVTFIGIFSGEWYTSDEIIRFMAGYEPPVSPVMDPGYLLQDRYQATVTPEAVVLNQHDEVVYQGKIDNWIVSLGKKRTVVNTYYLRDALHATLNGQLPEVRKTEAVGCFIE